MIISKTPVRISLFGGGTDYPDYFERKKGAVLGTTIDKYIYLSLNKLSQFFDYKIRVGYSKSELVNNIEHIEHPSVRECLRYKNIDGFLDIHIFADLPARTGLGSSSAFTVGFLNALHALEGKRISKQKLAEEACYIEQSCIKENVGSQDQFHAAFGGLNIIEFSEKNIHVKPVLITDEKLKALNEHALLFYTGISRLASKILKEQIQNTQSCSKDSYLEEMYQMVFEAEKIICSKPTPLMLESLGKLMDHGWYLKKQLSSKVSNPQIEDFYRRAKEAGAYGGKVCGAGAGGFLLILAPKDKHPNVREALKDLLEVNYNFEKQGSSIIYYRQ